MEPLDRRRGGGPRPPSVYPRRSRTAISSRPRTLGFPELPGVSQPAVPHLAYRAVYGPVVRTRRIASVQPPEVLSAFPILVPSVDADGNETGGLMMPEVAVPLATLHGLEPVPRSGRVRRTCCRACRAPTSPSRGRPETASARATRGLPSRNATATAPSTLGRVTEGGPRARRRRLPPGGRPCANTRPGGPALGLPHGGGQRRRQPAGPVNLRCSPRRGQTTCFSSAPPCPGHRPAPPAGQVPPCYGERRGEHPRSRGNPSAAPRCTPARSGPRSMSSTPTRGPWSNSPRIDWSRSFRRVRLDPVRGLITLMAPSRLHDELVRILDHVVDNRREQAHGCRDGPPGRPSSRAGSASRAPAWSPIAAFYCRRARQGLSRGAGRRQGSGGRVLRSERNPISS